MQKTKLSTVVSLGFVIFSSIYAAQAFALRYWNRQYAPGPGFIPRWAGSILLVLSIICLIQSFKEEGIKLKDALPRNAGTLRIFICWGALLFFALSANKLGVLVTSTVMLSVLFSIGLKWYKAIPIAIVVTLCAFYVFKVLLQIPVPINQFGW